MKRVCIAAMAAFAAAAAFAEAERVDYVVPSRVQQRQIELDQTKFDVKGQAIAAFGIMPGLEWPEANFTVTGVRFNLFAGEHVDVYGLDLGLIGNTVRREAAGLQVALVYNHVGETGGAVQLAIANVCDGDFAGLQAGIYNFAEKGTGVQIGIVNRANLLSGVQIGVANTIASSSVPFFPFVNCAF